MSNYTSQELRTIADAVDAHAAGKPVEMMQRTYTNGKWVPVDSMGIKIGANWLFRPSPTPEVIHWTRETLPPLPVEVVSKTSADRFIITAAREDLLLVNGCGWIEYAFILRDFTRPDGSPCGEVKA